MRKNWKNFKKKIKNLEPYCYFSSGSPYSLSFLGEENFLHFQVSFFEGLAGIRVKRNMSNIYTERLFDCLSPGYMLISDSELEQWFSYLKGMPIIMITLSKNINKLNKHQEILKIK